MMRRHVWLERGIGTVSRNRYLVSYIDTAIEALGKSIAVDKVVVGG